MKDDRSQKKYAGIWYFLFSKRAVPGHDLSCIIWKDVIFSRKHDIFCLDRKWEMTFLRKYVETWYFLWTRTGVANVVPRPSVKKNQRLSYSKKIYLKVIDVLDWHPRKSSSNSLYFHGGLYRRFHVPLSSEKKPGNLIYRIEVWLLLEFIRLEIFQ